MPLSPPPAAYDSAPPVVLPRWIAGVQVVLVCGIPTQLFLTVLLRGVGLPPFERGTTSFKFFVALSLLDTALVAALIRAFLIMSGERLRDVFVGVRPVRGEVVRGFLLLPVVFLAVTGVVLGLRAVAPWTHTVQENPFEGFLLTPLHAAVFMIVVVLAGGVREELQRAFILHRFDQRLGGARVGLAIFTLLFGALHTEQGVDVAVAVGLLGLLWGLIYLRRRSAIAPMVNHGSFDALQVVQGMLAKSMGA